MLQVNLSGQLIAGPAQVSECSEFPAGVTTIQLALLPACKAYAVTTGDQFVSLNSPSAFVTLAGVGTTVTAAHTLLVRTAIGVNLRLTQRNPNTSPTVQVISGMAGLLVLELASGYELTLLEAEGVGQVEYAAWGNA